MSVFRTIQARYTFTLIFFIISIVGLTIVGIKLFITPQLMTTDQEVLIAKVEEISNKITMELSKVQAQSRSITQATTLLDSDTIDKVLPALLDQYGDIKIVGGGIWPLPQKRTPGREKHSTFYVRDASGEMIANHFWNTPESPPYFNQPWYQGGVQALRGQCGWSAAFDDAASPEPRTACAMTIFKNNEVYGVSTINVTLNFFNQLVADKEKEISGHVMVVESNGTILSNESSGNSNIVLKNVSDLAGKSPFIATIQSALKAPPKSSELVQNHYIGTEGEDHTFLLIRISGTPWLLAASQPTRLLTAHGDALLRTLSMLQVPVVLLLLLLMVFALKKLINRLAILKSNIDSLSAGNADLTRRIPVKGQDEVDDVGNSVNRFIAYLSDMISDVSSATEQISDEIALLKQQSQHSNEILAQHASQTDQAVTAVTEMSATAESVAKNASDTASFTQQVNEHARASKLVVQEASSSVLALIGEVESATAKVQLMEQDTNRINDVLSVIGEIAGQTNLLALNAAIEAARAGEQGRGFAVVADEVRALAGRTQKSTSEINEMLSRLQQGVSAAVNAMDKTKISCQITADKTTKVHSDLDKMASSVTDISDLSNHIATAAEEQSAVSEEINHNMVSIRQIVEKLVANGESANRSTDMLQDSNNRLISLVNSFKTR